MFNTFRGGIHPPQRKIPTENSGIENLSVPQLCRIPMQQSVGRAAVPVVKVGDIVKEGQLIGRGSDDGSTHVHASVPGKVIDITESPTVFNTQTTIVIEAEGAFTTTGSSTVINDWRKSESGVLLDYVRSSGITGFNYESASSIKPGSGGEKNYILIINGTESEPYLTADDMMIRTYPSEIIEGIQITLKILGIKKAVVGIEENKKSTVRILKDNIKKLSPSEDITVKPLHSKYPQGSEKQLVYSVLKRAVPVNGKPADIGVCVLNTDTLFAIRDAVLFNKPVIERCVTVSGSLIKRPGNYKVRIGTMITDIVEECGGLKGVPHRIVIGGPMRGIAVNTTDIPVVKSATGILFLSEGESGKGDYNPCVRCGRCVAVCPMGLVPCEIAGAVERNRFDIAERLHAGSCILCSCCSYICPSGRPLSFLVKSAGEALPGNKE